jgi:hypothetical protein
MEIDLAAGPLVHRTKGDLPLAADRLHQERRLRRARPEDRQRIRAHESLRAQQGVDFLRHGAADRRRQCIRLAT